MGLIPDCLMEFMGCLVVIDEEGLRRLSNADKSGLVGCCCCCAGVCANPPYDDCGAGVMLEFQVG